MKILQIHNFYKLYGGSDKVVTNETQLLKTNNVDVVNFYKYNQEVDSYTLQQKLLFFGKMINNRKYLKELQELIIKEKPDIAHIHNIYPLISTEVYKTVALNNIPIVQTFHDHRLSLLCPQGNAFRHGKPCELCHQGFYWNCIKYNCFRNNLMLSIIYSLAVRKVYRKNILNKYLSAGIYMNDYLKNKLIGIGINPKLLYCKPHFLAEEISKQSLPKEKKFVFLGAVSKHKGILTLIKAFDEIPQNIKLQIIGTGDSVNLMKNIIKQNSNIEYIGEIKSHQRFEFLKNSYCLIFPTECFETFGLSIIEAFACGLPVIGSRIGGIPYVIDEGINGLLFKSGDPLDLRSKIIYLCENHDIRERMAKEAEKKYKSFFTPEENYIQLMNIYRSAIEYNKNKILNNS